MTEPSQVIVPPMPYLPVQADAELEKVVTLRRLGDGRTGLIAFTALDRLVDSCGNNQEWVLIHLSELDEINKRTPFDSVMLDPPVPASAVQNGKLA